MEAVFKNHTIVCGWNRRGKEVVEALLALTKRPVVVIGSDIRPVISDIGNHEGVFIIGGDCTKHDVLNAADASTAASVVVLVDESFGASADARSVQVALAVERLQVSVHTVVEVNDLRNKFHFNWTKADEVVADEEIAAKMLAQAIRHILAGTTGGGASADESALLRMYDQIIDPHHTRAQIFRIDLDWQSCRSLCFRDILTAALQQRVLPVAFAGYRRHEIASRPQLEAWTSWKIDVYSSPPPGKAAEQLWPQWPGAAYPLGIIVLARQLTDAQKLKERLSTGNHPATS